MAETESGKINRLVTKTVAIPLWMEDYLKDKARREQSSVSVIIRGFIKKDYDSSQEETAAGEEL